MYISLLLSKLKNATPRTVLWELMLDFPVDTDNLTNARQIPGGLLGLELTEVLVRVHRVGVLLDL